MSLACHHPIDCTPLPDAGNAGTNLNGSILCKKIILILLSPMKLGCGQVTQ